MDRIVVGPTGAFALTTAVPDLAHAAVRVARSAGDVRGFLARVLSWAPFVDALVVVEGHGAQTEAATVVPARLLEELLTRGPQVLADAEVARIAEHLEHLHALPA